MLSKFDYTSDLWYQLESFSEFESHQLLNVFFGFYGCALASCQCIKKITIISNDESKSFVERQPQDLFFSGSFLSGIMNAHELAAINGET